MSRFAANVSTLWETITMAAVTYMLGVLFATQAAGRYDGRYKTVTYCVHFATQLCKAATI